MEVRRGLLISVDGPDNIARMTLIHDGSVFLRFGVPGVLPLHGYLQELEQNQNRYCQDLSELLLFYLINIIYQILRTSN